MYLLALTLIIVANCAQGTLRKLAVNFRLPNKFLTKSIPILVYSASLLVLNPHETQAVSGGGKDFATKDLRGQDFSGQSQVGKDFTQCDATGVSFNKANLKGSRFYRAKLSEADFTNSILIGTALEDTDLMGAKFDNALLEVRE